MLQHRVQLAEFTSKPGKHTGPLSVPDKSGIDLLRDPNLNKVRVVFTYSRNGPNLEFTQGTFLP